MPTLTIKATFPLGTFLGHHDVGKVAEYPDTARLHAALLHAAGTGSTAEVDGDQLTPSAAALRALEWLEQHPPSALVLPRRHRVALNPARSWRNEGVIEGTGAKKTNPQDRKTLKSQSDAVAVGGPCGWAWDEEAPPEVVATLASLCEDVSCLGESDTPAVLEVADVGAPTHLRATNSTRLPPVPGIDIYTPKAGRTQLLVKAHRKSRPKKKPSSAQDSHGWNQQPTPPAYPSEGRKPMRYRSVKSEQPDIPWVEACCAPTSLPVKPEEKVAWCVAMHRALIAQFGDDAPALLTGRYPTDQPQPANHLAIHHVEGFAFPHDYAPHGAFVLLVPGDADPDDLLAIRQAFQKVKAVYLSSGRIFLGRRSTCDDLSEFWSPPNAGMTRLWSPSPALVAETRRQKSDANWSLTDAALLSVGHAFRHLLSEIPTGPQRYREVVKQVRALGVRVYQPHLIADSRVERYAHKLPSSMVAQPYTALLDLSVIVESRTLFALGQSRHLGGGLMYGTDVSASFLAELHHAELKRGDFRE